MNHTNKALARLVPTLLILLTACGDTIHGTEIAEPEVAKFHRRLDEQQFENIYDDTGEEFRNLPKERIIALFEAVHRKLGNVVSTKQVNRSTNTYNLKTTVVLVYQTKFQQGEATETFTFLIDDGDSELGGYNIMSLDMLIK